MIEPQTLTDTDEPCCSSSRARAGGSSSAARDPFYLHRLRDRPPGVEPRRRATLHRDRPASRQRRAGRGRGPRLVDECRLRNVRWRRTATASLLTEDRVGPRRDPLPRRRVPLENAYLARADNAAFALALAGPSRGRSSSSKACTDTARAAGLGAIPTPWKVALARARGRGRCVLAWSRSRRFGPPDRAAASSPPARAEYVRALACLARAHPRPRARARADAGNGPVRRSRSARTSGPTRRPKRSTAPRSRSDTPSRTRRGLALRRPTTMPRSRSVGSSRSCRNTMGERRERAPRSRGAGGPQGRRRPRRCRRGAARLGDRRRPPAARRRARRRQDAARERVRRAIGVEFRRVQFTPDMLPSDLTGTMTLRAGRARVPARSGVHQPPARRRDQPHAAEDAGRAARSDAGAPSERRRDPRPLPDPVHRGRDAEPDRVRGHVSRCPKRSSTASSPRSTSGIRVPTTKPRCSGSRTTASRPRRSTTCKR